MCEQKTITVKERNKSEIMIIGHRGNAKYSPENTMASYKKAHELGADIIETDVRITKDGILVFQHDDTIDRNTNGTGKIDEKTYQELLGYDFGYQKEFQDKYKGEPILSAENGIKYFKKNKITALYEIKTPAVIVPLTELIKKLRPLKKNTMFLVWNTDDAKEIKKHLKNYRIMHLAPLEDFLKAENKQEFFKEMQNCGITDFDVNFHQLFQTLSQENRELFMVLAAKYKMKVGVWTIDSTGDINTAAEYQVIGVIKNKTYTGKIDMITTNDPYKAVKLLGK